MAIVTDLTFESLNQAATADPMIGQNILTLTGNMISLDISALTGDTFAAITDVGVCEMMLKLRSLCNRAQIAENAATATTSAEELKSFPPDSIGIPNAAGVIDYSQTQSFQIPVVTSTVNGTN